jgi:hypothetical protein
MLQGAFEWGIACAMVAVVATIGGWYAAGWLQSDDSVAVPVRHVLASDKALPRVSAPPAPAPPAVVKEPRGPTRTWYRFVGVRGDTWLQVRSGSPRGRVLFDGTLTRGTARRFRERSLWVRFGAASNVNLRIAGRKAPLPLFGTFDGFVSRRGVKLDPVFHPDLPQATAAQSP